MSARAPRRSSAWPRSYSVSGSPGSGAGTSGPSGCGGSGSSGAGVSGPVGVVGASRSGVGAAGTVGDSGTTGWAGSAGGVTSRIGMSLAYPRLAADTVPDRAAQAPGGPRRRPRAVALEPRQGLLSRGRLHQGSPDRVLHARGAGRAAAPARPPADAQALPQRRHLHLLLREAVPVAPARLGAH